MKKNNFKINKEEIFLLLPLLFTTILIRGLILWPPLLFGQILDSLTANQIDGAMNKLLYILLASILILVLMPTIRYGVSLYVQKIVRRFSLDCLTDLLHKRYDFFQKQNIGDIISKVDRGILSFEKFLEYFVAEILPAGITLLMILLYFLKTSPIQIILVLIGGTFLQVIFSAILIKVRNPFIESINNIEDYSAGFLAEVLSSGKSIKSSGKIKPVLNVFSDIYLRYARGASQLSFISTSLKSTQEFLSLLTSAGILFAGVIFIRSGESMSVGKFVVLFSYSGLFLSNFRTIMTIYKEYKELKVDQKELFNILDYPKYRANNHINFIKNHGIIIPNLSYKIKGDLLFKNTEKIKIEEGSSLCITGKTGCGKTSLLEIIGGISSENYDIQLGEKFINNLSEKLLTETIFYASQEPEFLSGTFSRSIFFDDFYKPDNRVNQLLVDLHLDYFVEKIEDDYFPIKTLSGGEKKRLSLLRALLSPAKIIILDEPCSELDRKTAEITWGCIFRYTKGKTLICVTHDDFFSIFSHHITFQDGCIKSS